jgi:4-carboxymuconolactone decarboxylase
MMKDVSMKQNAMKTSIRPKVLRSAIVPIIAFAVIALMPIAVLSQSSTNDTVKQQSSMEQELINLSKQKWQWMSERKVDSLNALFHEKAVFVHMGATMTKTQELEVIRSGGIQYKTVEIQEASVRFIDKTAVLLNKIRLVAVVGGNEVTNPFMVTEVYVQQSSNWKLVSLSFTRLLSQ